MTEKPPLPPSSSSPTSTTGVDPVPPAARSTGEAPIIRVVGLHKSFGGREVLRGISLDVDRGSIVVILGGSGMGKSVLMKHVIGLLRPDRGQVFVEMCIRDRV